jgi:hypothetical protein
MNIANFWAERWLWAFDDEQAGMVFLPRALDAFGSARMPDLWPGVGAPALDRQNEAHKEEAKSFGFSSLEDYGRLLPQSGNWSAMTWAVADDMLGELQRGRMNAVLRLDGTGEYQPIAAAEWSAACGPLMLRTCQLDPATPRGADAKGWIFVTRQSLDAVIAGTLVMGPGAEKAPVRNIAEVASPRNRPGRGRARKFPEGDDAVIDCALRLRDEYREDGRRFTEGTALILAAIDTLSRERASTGGPPLEIGPMGEARERRLLRLGSNREGRDRWWEPSSEA